MSFKNYQVEKLLLELNSAAGTLETSEKEQELQTLIDFLEKHKEALRDYRDWLKDKGVPTENYRPIGGSESIMSQLAKRLKNGRAWSEKGVYAIASFVLG